MKHPAFLEATVWWVLFVGPQVGLAQELIPVSQFGDRGVIFQTRPSDYDPLQSARGVGDVNGDGFDDLLVSVWDKPAPAPPEFILIFGRPGLTGSHVLDESLSGTVRFRPRATVQYVLTYNESSAAAGDLNGDGFADFLFAYPYYPVDGVARGSAYLVYGSKDLKGTIDVEDLGVIVPGVRFYSSDPTSRGVGRALLRIGDLNGDGWPDLAIASPFSRPESVAPGGRVYLLLDTRNLPAEIDLARAGSTYPGMEVRGHDRVRRLTTGDAYAYFGIAIAAAGDFDGDRYDDLLVEETNYPPNSFYLIHGSARPPALLDLKDLIVGQGMPGVTVFYGPLDNGLRIGAAVGIGDLNLDGFSDLAMGLPQQSFFASEDSMVYLFHGATDYPGWVDLNLVPPQGVAAVFHAGGFRDGFGGVLSYSGDLNGDGVGDLLVGAPALSDRRGEAYAVFLKRDASGDTIFSDGFPGIRLVGDTPDERFGSQVASAGDFNGDGVPDFVVRTPGHRSMVSTGRAYVIYGVSPGPVPLRLHGVDPDHGPKRGGTVVTLRGSGFTGVPRVFFGDAAAQNVTVVSASELHALTPSAATPGFVEVRVAVGAEEAALAEGYEYLPHFPSLDLRNLGEGGLVLEGDPVESAERSLAGSGSDRAAFVDLDGDGADELLVKSRVAGSWRILVVRGGPRPPARIYAFAGSPHLAVVNNRSGRSTADVAVVGDVNGDGLDDAAIGEPGGTGFLLFGRTRLAAESIIEDEVDAGRAVRLERGAFDPQDSLLTFAPVGDLSGDGVADFATGFSRHSPGGLAGEVLLVTGQKSWSKAFDLDADSGFIRARITGRITAGELEAVGDVDGDGSPDLLVRGPYAGGVGFAYLIYGRQVLAGALDLEAMVADGNAVRIEIAEADFPNLSLAGPGDVTGDGFADLLLGDEFGGPLTNQGAVYLIPGGPDLLPVVTLLEAPVPPDGVVRVFGEGSLDQAGRVGAAGDFNADGFADFLVGSPGFQNLDPGNVFLVLGGRSLPERIELRRIGSRGLEIRGRNRPGGAGSFAGPSGDLNGDGQPDFVFGESARVQIGPPVPDPEGGTARVYVIFGPYGGKTFMRGDANSDGVVDVSDAVTILWYLFLGAAAPFCEDALDCDDQGTIEITDAILLLQFLYHAGTAPPAPHPLEGKDPTNDQLGCLGF